MAHIEFATHIMMFKNSDDDFQVYGQRISVSLMPLLLIYLFLLKYSIFPFKVEVDIIFQTNSCIHIFPKLITIIILSFRTERSEQTV